MFFFFFFFPPPPPPPQNGEFSERSDNRIFYRKKSGAKFITRGFLLEKVCKTRHILRRKKKKSEVAIFRQSVSGGRQNKATSLKTFVLCCLTSSRIWLISSCVDDRHLLDKIVKKKKKKKKTLLECNARGTNFRMNCAGFQLNLPHLQAFLTMSLAGLYCGLDLYPKGEHKNI